MYKFKSSKFIDNLKTPGFLWQQVNPKMEICLQMAKYEM